ncbi:hypothetical protein PR048_000254 [Dryococelus australis]|uniref:Uncharacterized protein n=1 Tax=Dryococelus australis TaxID=614101 RepID=A0ABQ9IE58_9NEOP|nr:hypothetical protein PR048_000254 [Dryococelus australis]
MIYILRRVVRHGAQSVRPCKLKFNPLPCSRRGFRYARIRVSADILQGHNFNKSLDNSPRNYVPSPRGHLRKVTAFCSTKRRVLQPGEESMQNKIGGDRAEVWKRTLSASTADLTRWKVRRTRLIVPAGREEGLTSLESVQVAQGGRKREGIGPWHLFGTRPAFAWSDFGKPRKAEIRMAGPGIEPGSSECESSELPLRHRARFLILRIRMFLKGRKSLERGQAYWSSSDRPAVKIKSCGEIFTDWNLVRLQFGKFERYSVYAIQPPLLRHKHDCARIWGNRSDRQQWAFRNTAVTVCVASRAERQLAHWLYKSEITRRENQANDNWDPIHGLIQKANVVVAHEKDPNPKQYLERYLQELQHLSISSKYFTEITLPAAFTLQVQFTTWSRLDFPNDGLPIRASVLWLHASHTNVHRCDVIRSQWEPRCESLIPSGLVRLKTAAATERFIRSEKFWCQFVQLGQDDNNGVNNVNSARQDKPNIERMTELPQSILELYEGEVDKFYAASKCGCGDCVITRHVTTLASHQGEPGLIPGGVTEFSSGNRAEKCRWSAGFLGDLSFPPAPSFQRCSIFTSITLIGSQDVAVKSRPNLFTRSRACEFADASVLVSPVSPRRFLTLKRGVPTGDGVCCLLQQRAQWSAITAAYLEVCEFVGREPGIHGDTSADLVVLQEPSLKEE